MAHEEPFAAADTGSAEVAVAALLVKAKTTCRLLRSDSAWANRKPFCKESVTARTWLLASQVRMAGNPKAVRMAKMLKVTSASISVNPALRRELRISIRRSS